MSWVRLSFLNSQARIQAFSFSTFPARIGTLLLAESHKGKVVLQWKIRRNAGVEQIITGIFACCAATECMRRLPGLPVPPAITVSPVAGRPIAPKISANRQRSNDMAGMNRDAMMPDMNAQQLQSSRKSFSVKPVLRRSFLKVMVARSPFCSVMVNLRTVPSS